MEVGRLSESGSLTERIAALITIGVDDLRSETLDHERLTDFLVNILDDAGFAGLQTPDRLRVVAKLTEIFTFTWHASSCRAIGPLQRAFLSFLAEPELDTNAVATACDLLYFLIWSGASSIERQTEYGTKVIQPLSDRLRAQRDEVSHRRPRAPRKFAYIPQFATLSAGNTIRNICAPFLRLAQKGRVLRRRSGAPLKIGYLSQFATPGAGNPIGNICATVLRVLSEPQGEYQPILYAWLYHDDATCAEHLARGVLVRRIDAVSYGERIRMVQDAIDADAPDLLITDMNTGLPTIIFERRSAPVQVFYQFGMPYWPIRELDGVIEVWQSDKVRVPYVTKRRFLLEVPFDFAPFEAPADLTRLAAERSRFPSGRLIGTYGRLSKITPLFLSTIAEAIADVPNVTVILGGTGDAGPVLRALAAMVGGDRFVVVEGHVEGHLWGHLVDVFLDTFPQQGGASCMEVFAKGKPVVSLVSPEMPNFAAFRVPTQTAADPAGYARILHRLLIDPDHYQRACEDVRTVRRAFPVEADYGRRLRSVIDDLLATQTGTG